MSKRKPNGHYVQHRSLTLILTSWLASFASIGFVYLTGRMLMTDLAASLFLISWRMTRRKAA